MKDQSINFARFLSVSLTLCIVFGFFSSSLIPLTLTIILLLIATIWLCFIFYGANKKQHILSSLSLLTFYAALVVYFYARIYQILGLKDGNNITHDLSDCVYFSIITWTTVGYGDLLPSKDARFYAATEPIIGVIFMGLYISILTSYFSYKRST